MFQIKFAEKIKTHILCLTMSFYKNRAVYEIMWENTVESDRPHTIQDGAGQMRFAYRINSARRHTHTHTHTHTNTRTHTHKFIICNI